MAALVATPLVWVYKNGMDPVSVFCVGLGWVMALPLLLGGVALRRAAAAGESVGLARFGWWLAALLTVAAPVGEIVNTLLD